MSVTLTIGQVSESITITAEAPLLHTANAEMYMLARRKVTVVRQLGSRCVPMPLKA